MAEKKKEKPVFSESADTASAASALAAAEASGAGAYESKYAGLIDDAAKRILAGEKFSYNIAADPVYASLRERAEKDRRRAVENAAASAAALTGGYANSYGVTAGEEASAKIYDSLTGVIPSLLDAAYKRWQGERDAENDRLRLLMSLEDADYGRYRDAVGDAKDERNYLYGKYSDLSKRDRELFAAALDEFFTDRDYDRRVYESDRDAAYRAERDRVEDAMSERQYQLDYMKAAAAAAASNARAEAAREAAKAASKDEKAAKTDNKPSAAAERFREIIANGSARSGKGNTLSGDFVKDLKKAKRSGEITTSEYDELLEYARRVGIGA